MRTLLLAVLLTTSAALAQSQSFMELGKKPRCTAPGLAETDRQPAGVPLAPQLPSARPIRLRTFVHGWALTGSPNAYELGCDELASTCGIAILRSTSAQASDAGSLTHVEPAAPWRGARVSVRAELRAGRIDGWAGVWLRVEGKDGKLLAARSLKGAGLTGTSSFRWYSVELDVPEGAEQLSLGVELHGRGAVFVRELQLEAADTPVTASR